MKKNVFFGVLFILAGLALAYFILPVEIRIGEEETKSKDVSELRLVNPASKNCQEKGGTTIFKEKGDLGSYGICDFGGTKRCEEWAMYRNDCPVGGIDVKGYVDEAEIYCLISGGKLQVGDSQKVCLLKSGQNCEVNEYYNGSCF